MVNKKGFTKYSLICLIKDCLNPYNPSVGSHGMCSKHCARLRRNGDPNIVKLIPNRKCSIEGCGKKHYGKNYCRNHFSQFKRYGDPLKTHRNTPECIIFGCKSKPQAKNMCHIHYHRFKRREYPRSSYQYPVELRLAMDNVRKRDNSACKWYNCGLTYRETSIHVHHIFPRSEYPELELIEKYMICYCAKHHSMFHYYRGDYYSNLIIQSDNRHVDINHKVI